MAGSFASTHRKVSTPKTGRLRLSLRLAGLAGLLATALAASEVTALHLVFEKTVPMRRASAQLYLSYSGWEEASLSCAVLPAGNRGRLEASGKLQLRLLGESAGGAVWESPAVERALDERGEAGFSPAELAELVEESSGGGDLEWIEVVWRGGRGKRVATLTVDCSVEVDP